jgi:hypothetical protein
MGFAYRDGYSGGSAVEYVDLRRRRGDHARRKPEASRRSAARDSLFFFGAGFLLGCIVSLFFYNMLYMGDFSALSLFVLTLALLCYLLRLLGKRPGETGPKFGSEKQLLMAIRAADDGLTPVEAALGTPLTVDEAEEILTSLADRGHLVVHSRDAALLYALPGGRHAPKPGSI